MLDNVMYKIASQVENETTAEIVEKVATKTTYLASGVGMVGGFTMDQWGVIFGCVGAVIAFTTMIFNFWFKMRYLRPKQREKYPISDRRKAEKGDKYEN